MSAPEQAPQEGASAAPKSTMRPSWLFEAALSVDQYALLAWNTAAM